jgi:hypothetical protein
MRRLMGRHATREDEVDALLRAEVFVDLYQVVRQSILLGASNYSLKTVEKLYQGQRKGDVKSAGHREGLWPFLTRTRRVGLRRVRKRPVSHCTRFPVGTDGTYAGVFSDVVFAISDWSPERRFLRPFHDAFPAFDSAARKS